MILDDPQIAVLLDILEADRGNPSKPLNLSGRKSTEPRDPVMRALQSQGAVMCIQAANKETPFDTWMCTESGISEIRRQLTP